MTLEELRYIALVQAKELRASRKTIERQERKLRELNYELERAQARNPTDAESVREAYRIGYKRGWDTGKKGREFDNEPERTATSWVRDLVGGAA